MATDPRRDPGTEAKPTPAGGHTDQQETKPAEEWGERVDTGKRIARGGKESGPIPGATESQ